MIEYGIPSEADKAWAREMNKNSKVLLAELKNKMEHEYPISCHDCGKAYGIKSWIEAIVPNDVWAKISPSHDEGGILCIGCMAIRCARLGLEAVPVALGAGPLELVPDNPPFVDVKVGDWWKIIPNESYPYGWTSRVVKIHHACGGEYGETLIFWEDGTNTKLKHLTDERRWRRIDAPIDDLPPMPQIDPIHSAARRCF